VNASVGQICSLPDKLLLTVWTNRVEVRNVDGRLHIARQPRHHDEWDLPIAPYDPTGRASMSSLMTESAIDHAGPALHVTADRGRSQRSASDHANPVIDHYALSGALSPVGRKKELGLSPAL
jgi:hypothetical protein